MIRSKVFGEKGDNVIRNKRFWRSNNARQVSFKKNQFAILICIGLIVSVAFTSMNIQLASADIQEKTLHQTPGYPSGKTNISEIQYCDTADCHENDEPTTWITVTVDSQTPSEITYYVTGSDNYAGEEGWAVFDELQNNRANGFNSGYFTLPKCGETYRVFWVDNETDGTRGSAFEDITPPNDPPSKPTIDGPSSGKAGESHSFKFTSEDPQEQDVFYYVEWGDDTNTDWFGPHPSGETKTKSHTWEKGTWTIRAKARDTCGAESGWSTHVFEAPKNKALNFNLNLLEWLFEQFPNAFPMLRYLLGI
ncbi:MAG: hypothetical protein JSW60_04330 [Thermoplasmatales archaeon]|nr:MAG: hypothetical protein JSW60_04330 [Thermoplasmatales archaeon]